VLVLDSGSTDQTATIARAAGARVVVTDWPGYGPQVARGFSLTQSDWVLSLDADERIPAKLQAEIRAAIQGAAHDGYRIPRWSEFCGKVMHHGGWRPDRTLRLGRRTKSGFTADFLHAHMTVDGPVGDLLRQMERHPMRPAHMHAIVSAPGYRQVITHVFVEGDPYLDSDAVFAVKESLIAKYRTVDSADEAKKLGMPAPFLRLDWDFRLAPEAGVKARATISAADAAVR